MDSVYLALLSILRGYLWPLSTMPLCFCDKFEQKDFFVSQESPSDHYLTKYPTVLLLCITYARVVANISQLRVIHTRTLTPTFTPRP